MTAVTKLSLSTSPGVWQISLPFQGEEEIVGSYVIASKTNWRSLIPVRPALPMLCSLRSVKQALTLVT